MRKNEKELKEALDSLERKISEVSSNDGIVSIKFSGMGEYLSLNINLPLEELDKDTLEKSIIECLEISKTKIGDDLFKLLKERVDRERSLLKEQEDDDDDYGVTIKDVS